MKLFRNLGASTCTAKNSSTAINFWFVLAVLYSVHLFIEAKQF